jgi:hypothetical protein
MSEQSTADSEQVGIYLAGPVEHDDDPRTWRDELKDRFPDVNWIDPMDWQDDFEDPMALWERDLDAVRNNPVLVCNIGDEAPRTTGTHHEIREALYHDQPVGIVPEGSVSWIYRDVLNVWLYDEVEHAIADLTCPELVDDGLRADGGKVWRPQATGKTAQDHAENVREDGGDPTEVVYYTTYSDRYHTHPECPHLEGSDRVWCAGSLYLLSTMPEPYCTGPKDTLFEVECCSWCEENSGRCSTDSGDENRSVDTATDQ